MRECVTFLKMSLLVGFFKASRMLRVLGFGHTDRIEVWRDACIRKDEQGDPDAQHDRSRVLQRGIPPSDDQDAQRLATGGGRKLVSPREFCTVGQSRRFCFPTCGRQQIIANVPRGARERGGGVERQRRCL